MKPNCAEHCSLRLMTGLLREATLRRWRAARAELLEVTIKEQRRSVLNTCRGLPDLDWCAHCTGETLLKCADVPPSRSHGQAGRAIYCGLAALSLRHNVELHKLVDTIAIKLDRIVEVSATRIRVPSTLVRIGPETREDIPSKRAKVEQTCEAQETMTANSLTILMDGETVHSDKREPRAA